MTPKQAHLLYYLTAQTQWSAFVEYKTDRLAELHQQLEMCSERELAGIQGQIAEIKRDLNVRNLAEDVLNSGG